MNTRWRNFAIALSALTLIGCAATTSTDVAPDTGTPETPPAPQNARATPRKLFQLDSFLLRVPRDMISQNDAFWKRLDEDCVDFSTRERLARNGIRVGRAHRSELAAIQDFLDDADGNQSSIVGSKAQDVAIEMQTGIDRQTIWFFDRRGDLRGIDQERCDNLVYLNFRQVPRKPDVVRIALAPAVRSRVEKFRVEQNPAGDRTFTLDKPETLYDAGLSVDVPIDHFLVVAPGPAAADYRSIGRLFFVENSPAQQLERVVVIIPSLKAIETDVVR
jgi:hypothetical protein